VRLHDNKHRRDLGCWCENLVYWTEPAGANNGRAISDLGKIEGRKTRTKKVCGESTGGGVGMTKNGCKGEGILLHYGLQTATPNSPTASIEVKAGLACLATRRCFPGDRFKNWEQKP
jgi:hypothetical protein